MQRGVLADMQYHHIIDDQLLRFFDHCRGYVEGVENNRTALQEVDKFKHGEEMEALRRKTARRLGLHHQRFTTGHAHTRTMIITLCNPIVPFHVSEESY